MKLLLDRDFSEECFLSVLDTQYYVISLSRRLDRFKNFIPVNTLSLRRSQLFRIYYWNSIHSFVCSNTLHNVLYMNNDGLLQSIFMVIMFQNICIASNNEE